MIPTVETPADGFTSINEMAAFWTATHGAAASHFEGVLIRWGPLAAAGAGKGEAGVDDGWR